MALDIGEIMDALHASEITGQVGWLYDGCWTVSIGQASNRAEDVCNSMAEAAEWLREKAVELYPKSDFAAEWRRGFD